MNRLSIITAALVVASGAANAELQFNADMPWTNQDVENTATSGGSGPAPEPAAPDPGAWVTFVNTFCGESFADYAAFEADDFPIECTFTDSDVTTNWPDRANWISYRLMSGADVTNVDFLATAGSPEQVDIDDPDGNLTDISGLGGIDTLESLQIVNGLGITDLSPIGNIQFINGASVYIGQTSATAVPTFQAGMDWDTGSSAIHICAGFSQCGTGTAGALDDVSGLANVDLSLLGNDGVLLENRVYTTKAPAGSTFCTSWVAGKVTNGSTDIPKSSLCE